MASPEALDPVAVERELCRLPPIVVAHLVIDDGGRIIAVRVVATGTDDLDHLARDVQSVALASFGLELDRRIISVARLDDDAAAAHDHSHETEIAQPTSPGPELERLRIEIDGRQVVVGVSLVFAGVRATGHTEGTAAASLRPRIVAAATVDALQQLSDGRGGHSGLDLGDALIVRIGADDVAVVTLMDAASASERVLTGSAVVTDRDDAPAVVRAVLDAAARGSGTSAA